MHCQSRSPPSPSFPPPSHSFRPRVSSGHPNVLFIESTSPSGIHPRFHCLISHDVRRRIVDSVLLPSFPSPPFSPRVDQRFAFQLRRSARRCCFESSLSAPRVLCCGCCCNCRQHLPNPSSPWSCQDQIYVLRPSVLQEHDDAPFAFVGHCGAPEFRILVSLKWIIPQFRCRSACFKRQGFYPRVC